MAWAGVSLRIASVHATDPMPNAKHVTPSPSTVAILSSRLVVTCPTCSATANQAGEELQRCPNTQNNTSV